MTSFIVAAIYIFIFSLLIYKLEFFSLKKLNKKTILSLFLLKVLAGFIYVYVSQNYLSAGDVFSYYKDGIIVYDQLLNGEVLTFLQLTFGLNNVNITPNIAQSVYEMGYWYDSSAYMMVRSNALINIFTFGSGVYANAVFFSFVSFLACILLAKLFEEHLQAKSYWVYVSIFLTPSLFFWTSGMHKETLSVVLIALILYSFFHKSVKYRYSSLLVFVLSFGLLYQTRFFIASMLLPPIVAYLIWLGLKKYRPLIVFASFFSLVLVGTYLIPAVFGLPNLVDEVLEKKALYEALDNGNTAINLGTYQESYLGIFLKTPQALFNALVRPHFLDIKSFFLGLASLESLLISVSFLVSLFYIKQLNQKERAIIFVFFGFAISYLILTGLIVPNLGAILRYRSVALFLLVPSIAFLIEKRNVF